MSGLSETMSALEVVRALVALFGLTVSLRGRALVRAQSETVSVDAIRHERLRVYEMLQSGASAVHAMLLANALIQMAWPSPSIENFNVLVSNVTQVMIPLILARVSEHVSLQIRRESAQSAQRIAAKE